MDDAENEEQVRQDDNGAGQALKKEKGLDPEPLPAKPQFTPSRTKPEHVHHPGTIKNHLPSTSASHMPDGKYILVSFHIADITRFMAKGPDFGDP